MKKTAKIVSGIVLAAALAASVCAFAACGDNSDDTDSSTGLTHVAAVAAQFDSTSYSPVTPGNIEYWKDADGKYYSDSEGKNEITVYQTVDFGTVTVDGETVKLVDVMDCTQMNTTQGSGADCQVGFMENGYVYCFVSMFYLSPTGTYSYNDTDGFKIEYFESDKYAITFDIDNAGTIDSSTGAISFKVSTDGNTNGFGYTIELYPNSDSTYANVGYFKGLNIVAPEY